MNKETPRKKSTMKVLMMNKVREEDEKMVMKSSQEKEVNDGKGVRIEMREGQRMKKRV